MGERKTGSQAWGETIREIGILVFVFLPLDALFAEGHRPPGDFVAIFWIWAVLMIVVGIFLEVAENE